MKWVVKIERGNSSAVLGVHESHADAINHAGHLNARYQTDEYRVEAWKDTPDG